MRALIELVFVVIFIWAARLILRSVLSGLSQAARGERIESRQQPGGAPVNGMNLHKDPVCGTYVADNARFQADVAGQRFYYCSEDCQHKHALVGRR